MTGSMDRADAALVDWLRDGPDSGPIEVLEAILAQTRSVPQRPAWTFSSRWLPTALNAGRPGIGVLAALIAAIVFAISVGTQRRLPPPFGLAANGAVVYDTGNGGHAYLADASGSNPRPLPGDGIERQPTFSPDGTQLVYYSRPPSPAPQTSDPRGRAFHIFVANADGSNAHPILDGMTFRLDVFTPPSWSPDSRSIAFRSDNDGTDQIWVVNVDGPAPRAPITRGTATRSAPAWSPDGKWIAYVESRLSVPAVNALVVARPDGSGRVVLHQQQSVSPGEASFGESLRWSPDSRSIAYARGRDPANPDESDGPHYLAVATLEGDEAVVYTDVSGWLHFPTWSLDGRLLYFTVGEASNVIRVHDLATSTDSIVGVCEAPISGPLQLSPNGKQLVAACPGAAMLGAASSGGPDAGLALPANAGRIDIQRLAP
jgi:Tol biopolymer transport system component